MSTLNKYPADERSRRDCATICRAIIDKRSSAYRPSDDTHEFYLIFHGCHASGRNDLAQKAIRAYPCRSSTELLTLIGHCQAIQSGDLAAAAIGASRCTGTKELIAVAKACRSIAREDLLDDIVLAHPCEDQATFFAVFTTCMEIKRVDLGAKAIEKLHSGTGKRGKITLADFQKAVVASIIAHSMKFPFAEWRKSLDCAMSHYGTFADCHHTLRKISREWKYLNNEDSTAMMAWKRSCRDSALTRVSSLSDADAVAMKQIISEEGTSWIKDS